SDLYYFPHYRLFYSIPTRRSSDLDRRLDDHQSRFVDIGRGLLSLGDQSVDRLALAGAFLEIVEHPVGGCGTRGLRFGRAVEAGKDRKSTRLNSSHVKISYAVFCLQ